MRVYHVTRWLLTVSLISYMIRDTNQLQVTDVQCDDVVNQAEKAYYADQNQHNVTYLEAANIQHGHGVTHKLTFIRKYILNQQIDGYDCTFTRNKRSRVTKRQKRGFHPHDECGLFIPDCNPGDMSFYFRTADGSCNNLVNAEWGKAGRRQNRILPNAYEDGLSTPRQVSNCTGGGKLPSPRAISSIVHSASGGLKTESKLSYQVMQWGFILSNDIVITPTSTDESGEPLVCCTGPSLPAPPATDTCFSIAVPVDHEKRFPHGGCIEFTRSQRVSCTDDVEQQVNLQTSYIDASMVYGTSSTTEASLRTGQGGLLETVGEEMLPPDQTDASCRLAPGNPNNYYCFRAGDIRVNFVPGLTSMHTLLMREHNRIARGLASHNPAWSDQKLFLEARKIVSAEIQHITFNEWLPLIIGRSRMQQEGISLAESGGFSEMYDPTVDATIINSFAAASYRFGHSLVHRRTGTVGQNYTDRREYPLKEHYLRTDLVLEDGRHGPGNILRWTSSVKCPRSDRSLEDSIRNYLLLDKDGNSLDLASTNNQRGRDHGLPSYNDFREYCGLSRAITFETDANAKGLRDHSRINARLLSQVYSCPDDIDLFAGSLTETKIKGTLLGPTQACLVVEQFKRLKVGDRFWYERNSTEAFTIEQLDEIRKVRLSSLICDNTATSFIQRNVFLAPRSNSSSSCRRDDRGVKPSSCMDSCGHFQRLDLSKWTNAGVPVP